MCVCVCVCVCASLESHYHQEFTSHISVAVACTVPSVEGSGKRYEFLQGIEDQ